MTINMILIFCFGYGSKWFVILNIRDFWYMNLLSPQGAMNYNAYVYLYDSVPIFIFYPYRLEHPAFCQQKFDTRKQQVLERACSVIFITAYHENQAQFQRHVAESKGDFEFNIKIPVSIPHLDSYTYTPIGDKQSSQVTGLWLEGVMLAYQIFPR